MLQPDWSSATRSVWGKTKPDEGNWLPLIEHLLDTIVVAGHLWDHRLPRIVKTRLIEVAGSDAHARSLIVWLAGVHDIAKATPAFAVKARAVGMDWLLDEMARSGLTCPHVPADSYAHHGVMGQVILEDWLASGLGMPLKAARTLGVIVGGHHGIPPTAASLDAVRTSSNPAIGSPAWGNDAWRKVRQEILDGIAELTDIRTVLARLPERGLPLTVQVDVSAVLVMADWLASDDRRFPYATDVPTPADGHARRERGLASIDLPPPWDPSLRREVPLQARAADRFPRLADKSIHPAQAATSRAAWAAASAPLLVLEAGMGNGKTEAALLAAEVLATRFDSGGMFVALPTMATANAMFSRILAWVRRLPGGNEASVYLAHSKAGLNDEYLDLARGSRVSVAGVFDEDLDDAEARTAPRVAWWLSGRKLGVLADHVIGTIDQALVGALQTRHLVLRHLALSGKVVILDEIHAADDYMREYACRVLEWLGAYGTPVILLSATLPRAQREQLVSAYVRGRLGSSGRAQTIEVPEPTTYPCLTVATDHVESVAIPSQGSSTCVDIELIDDDDLVNRVLREVSDGGCAAVIHNTVGRAQATYERLRHHLGDDVMLLHSRFIGPDRHRLETELLSLVGPPGPDVHRPNRFVVVGTQVLEQSLDADFDFLVSDLAPIDLVLQRVGRLHRHDRPEDARPPRLRQPQLLLTGVQSPGDDGPPTFERGSQAVYGAYRLMRSLAVLRPMLDAGAALQLPQDIPRLVDCAYDEPGTRPPAWADAWVQALARHERLLRESLDRADAFRLEAPRRRSLVDWLSSPVTAESDDLERAGRAQVRDSEDSLEVVLMRRDADGLMHVMPGRHPLADAVVPSQLGVGEDEVARAAAACTVRLPRSLTHPGIFDRVLDELEATPGIEGWQTNRWLRGQLVVALDDELGTVLCEQEIRYDQCLGLLVGSTTEHEG